MSLKKHSRLSAWNGKNVCCIIYNAHSWDHKVIKSRLADEDQLPTSNTHAYWIKWCSMMYPLLTFLWFCQWSLVEYKPIILGRHQLQACVTVFTLGQWLKPGPAVSTETVLCLLAARSIEATSTYTPSAQNISIATLTVWCTPSVHWHVLPVGCQEMHPAPKNSSIFLQVELANCEVHRKCLNTCRILHRYV